MAAAFREIPLAISQMYSHRMTIYYQQNIAWYIDESVKAFSRLGYKVLPLTDLTLTTAAKDTLMIIVSDDHPVTSEIYDWQNLLVAANEKKIFILHSSNRVHEYNEPNYNVLPYELRVLRTSADRSIALSGEKSKFFPYFNSGLDWSKENSENFELKKNLQEKKNEIEQFESDPGCGFIAYIKPTQKRIYDRSVVYWSDMDGFSFVEELIRLSNRNWQIGLHASCTSLCYWGNSPVITSMSVKESPETIRGLVVLDASIVNSDLSALVLLARKNILLQQLGH